MTHDDVISASHRTISSSQGVTRAARESIASSQRRITRIEEASRKTVAVILRSERKRRDEIALEQTAARSVTVDDPAPV